MKFKLACLFAIFHCNDIDCDNRYSFPQGIKQSHFQCDDELVSSKQY